MIKAVNGKKIAEKNFYIKWPRKINVSREAARITRFDIKRYEEVAIPHDQVFPTIEDWLDNSDYVLGHNILGFDLYLIKDFYKEMGKDYKHLTRKIIDTMCIARAIKYGEPYKHGEDFLAWQYKMLHTYKKGVRTSLVALGKEFDINHNYEKLHNAIVDLELNLKVWNKIKWMTEI